MPIEKYPVKFVIDELRCVVCGFCVEACPKDAIRMDTGEHAPPSLERKGQIQDIQTLLRGPAVSYHSDPWLRRPSTSIPADKLAAMKAHRPALPRRRQRRVRVDARLLGAGAGRRGQGAGQAGPVVSGPVGPTLRVRRAWPLLAALAAAAALLDLGTFHRLENGDSIVPVLVSLQRWTPFYWDQERYGMLAPLLALPVRDPLWNLLLQRGLTIFAGLAAVVLLSRHLLAERDWRLVGAVAAATLILAAPEPWRFEYLGDQPYGLSLALALAGLAFAEPAAGGARRSRRRLAVGLLLVLLAHWVNPATGVLLGLLALARALEDWFSEAERGAVRERLLVDAGLLAVGLTAGQLSIMLYPVDHRPAALPHRRVPAAGAVACGVGRDGGPGLGRVRRLGLGAAGRRGAGRGADGAPVVAELPARRPGAGRHAGGGGDGLRGLRRRAGLGGDQRPPPALPGAGGGAPPPGGDLAAGRAPGAGGPGLAAGPGRGLAGAPGGRAGGGRCAVAGAGPRRPRRGGGEAHRGRAGGPLPPSWWPATTGRSGRRSGTRRWWRGSGARLEGLGGEPPDHAHGDAVEGAAGRVDPDLPAARRGAGARGGALAARLPRLAGSVVERRATVDVLELVPPLE